MKCKYCGGDVTLDDHFCPHCGKPVDQAQRHQREMEQFETEFEETKKEALDKIAVSSGGGTAVGIRLAAITLLFAALIFEVIYFEPYSLNERKEKREATKNYDAYIAQMEEYLENRDFLAFEAFSDKHRLEYNDDYKQYRGIFTAAMDFKNIYRGLQEVAFSSDSNSSDLYYAQQISKNVNTFYEDIGREYYLRDLEDPEHTKEVYGEMEQEFAVLMQKYLRLTAEETDSLKDLSKSKRTVLIEQALDEVLSSRAVSAQAE